MPNFPMPKEVRNKVTGSIEYELSGLDRDVFEKMTGHEGKGFMPVNREQLTQLETYVQEQNRYLPPAYWPKHTIIPPSPQRLREIREQQIANAKQQEQYRKEAERLAVEAKKESDNKKKDNFIKYHERCTSLAKQRSARTIKYYDGLYPGISDSETKSWFEEIRERERSLLGPSKKLGMFSKLFFEMKARRYKMEYCGLFQYIKRIEFVDAVYRPGDGYLPPLSLEDLLRGSFRRKLNTGDPVVAGEISAIKFEWCFDGAYSISLMSPQPMEPRQADIWTAKTSEYLKVKMDKECTAKSFSQTTWDNGDEVYRIVRSENYNGIAMSVEIEDVAMKQYVESLPKLSVRPWIPGRYRL